MYPSLSALNRLTPAPARPRPPPPLFLYSARYFVLDKDSTAARPVFNLAVSLRENVTKSGPSEEVQMRRAMQAEQAAKNAALADVDPKDFFKVGEFEGMFSQYLEDGVPTHDAEGTALTKSAMKKLKKDQAKFIKKKKNAAKRG